MYSTDVDGETLEFGTSGMLYRSNKLMYDRTTKTLWHQFRGEPVVGPLADSGIRLQVLPLVVTTWGEWLAAHPDTTVLDISTGVYPPDSYPPETDPASVYYSYRESAETMFPVWQRSNLLSTKAQVLGISVADQAKAYPLELLRQQPVLNDSLADKELVIVTRVEAGAARAYERAAHRFFLAQPSSGPGETVVLVDEDGRRWQMEEEALVQVDDPSQRLQRLPSHMAYWFGWYSFYPATQLYGESPLLP